MASSASNPINPSDVLAWFDQPFNDLLFKAHQVHKKHFNPNEVQASTLMSIKTGSCPEDCKYCSQSIHYQTDLKKEKLLDIELVLNKAKQAKASGATRFCMGAAWRAPTNRQVEQVCKMVEGVKQLGLETCVTLGMLKTEQAKTLKKAGLDYYNHNVDTSKEHYPKIVSTHTFEDRINTLKTVANEDIKVCCGGILGMGESREDRANMLYTLATLSPQPQSVPINQLVPIPGTPLGDELGVDAFEFIKTIAVARLLMPETYVRLSAGREQMSDQTQALCFFAGANSIFYGDQLLTTANPQTNKDNILLKKLGISLEKNANVVNNKNDLSNIAVQMGATK